MAVACPVDREAGLTQACFDTAADQIVVFYEKYAHEREIPFDVYCTTVGSFYASADRLHPKLNQRCSLQRFIHAHMLKVSFSLNRYYRRSTDHSRMAFDDS